MTEQDLVRRLDRLEKENRRLKRWGLAAFAGALGLTTMSFVAPAVCDIVYAERFVLRDASNTKRITMNAYGTDTPEIVFHDARGKKVGSVGLTRDGGFDLRVMDKGKAVRAAFSIDDDGAMRLAKVASPKARTAAKSKDAPLPPEAGGSGAD